MEPVDTPDEYDFKRAFSVDYSFDLEDFAHLALYGPGKVPGEVEACFEGLAIGTESHEASAVLTADLLLTKNLGEILKDVEESADVTVVPAETESAVAPAIGAVVAMETADAATWAVAAAGDEVRPSLFFCWLCRLPLSARRSGPPIVLKLSVPFAAHAQTHAGPPFESRD